MVCTDHTPAVAFRSPASSRGHRGKGFSVRAVMQTMRWTAALGVGVLLAGAAAAAAQTGREARLLVLLRDASALAVVDPAAGTVLGQVPTVQGPHEVTASPDGTLAFVASPSDGISVIDLETLTELRRLDLGTGSEPHDVRFAGGKLYFTVEGFKAIGRYDPGTDEVDWLLGLGQDGTHMLVLGPDRDTIFTANRESNTVSVVDGAVAGPPDWQATAIPVGGAVSRRARSLAGRRGALGRHPQRRRGVDRRRRDPGRQPRGST